MKARRWDGTAMRIALIGCGNWGANHARTLAQLGVLAAVGDREGARADALADALGCMVAAPDEILADPGIDGVVLALAPEAHVAACVAALEAGKHVLVEKPMALDTAGAEAIVAAARAAGTVAMTGHLLRFNPAFRTLEQLVAAGRLGRLRHVRAVRTGLGKFFSGADAMWDMAPHDLSMVLALAGEAAEGVASERLRLVGEQVDAAHLALRFPSGLVAQVDVSRLAPERVRRLSVVGTQGMAVFDDLAPPGRRLVLYPHRVWREDGGIRHAAGTAEAPEIDDSPPLAAELGHFIDCIATGTAPRASVREGLDILRLLAVAERSPDMALSRCSNDGAGTGQQEQSWASPS